MEKVTKTEQVNISGLEAIHLPLFALKAALSCASTEETRYYLNGIFVQSHEDTAVRLVATDGNRMFVYAVPAIEAAVGGKLPKWLGAGVIVPSEYLKDRLALLEKLECTTAVIAYQTAAPHIVLANPDDTCRFRLSPVDGTFPAYGPVLDTLQVFEGRERADLSSVSYNPAYLKGVGALAKLLDSDSVRLFANEEGGPSFITFPGRDGAVLVLMPMRQDPSLGVQTAKVVSGPMSGTIAALKAHRTRWADKLDGAAESEKAEIEAKMADYDRRIAEILARTAGPALPPPKETETADEGMQPELAAEPIASKVTSSEVVPLHPQSYAIAEAVAEPPAAERPSPAIKPADADDTPDTSPGCELRGARRRTLPKGKRRREMTVFVADINAILSREHGGLTVSQLADGVPIESWFDAGLRPEAAAERCREWLPASMVLPPDEVQPGEEYEPMGHLTVAEEATLEAAE